MQIVLPSSLFVETANLHATRRNFVQFAVFYVDANHEVASLGIYRLHNMSFKLVQHIEIAISFICAL